MENSKRPRIGFALSGAAARSVFYIGFLEVMKENKITIDYISAQSGATIVAAAFACNNLEALKKEIFALDRKTVFSLIKGKGNKGGWYNLDAFEDLLREKITHSATFDSVTPRLIFVATDLNAGEPVEIAMGDIARGCRYSCTVPGLFEPESWGSKLLVDGGVASFIPSEPLRKNGADIVIGVNVRATQHIFLKSQLRAKHIYNILKRKLLLHRLGRVWFNARSLMEQTSALDYLETFEYIGREAQAPGMFAVIGKSLDLANEALKKTNSQSPLYGCDLLIREGTGDFGGSVRIKDMQELYKAGREAGHYHTPEIVKLLAQHAIDV